MERDLKSMPVDELWSLQELAPPIEKSLQDSSVKYRAQQQRIQRLDEYFNQTVAEIRASLDQTQDEGS